MRKLLVLVLVLGLASCTDGPFGPGDRSRDLAGTYWAETVDGRPLPHWSHSFLDAALELRANGTFSEWWFLEDETYEFHGHWHRVGDEIRLSEGGQFLESGYVYGRRIELSESGIVYVRTRDYY